jgi:uridylate kinase
MKQREIVVISLGGSLIVPGEIDTLFLKRFINLLRERTEKGERFVILTGGGRICRKYQEAAKKVRKLSSFQC